MNSNNILIIVTKSIMNTVKLLKPQTSYTGVSAVEA
jgi:hypothetical protein